MPSKKIKKHQPPRLCITDLDDPEVLARKIDAILLADVKLRRWGRRIRKVQEELRAVVGNDNFRIYLRVEEEVTARGVHALDVVAVWAFTEGLAGNAT